MEYTVTATLMRADRLLAFILSMAMMANYGPSLWRLIRGRTPVETAPAAVTAVEIAAERERGRAIWALLAGGVFLIQLRWLTPGLPELWTIRIWLVGISLVNAVLIAIIFHDGRTDARFNAVRATKVWSGVALLCLMFAAASA